MRGGGWRGGGYICPSRLGQRVKKKRQQLTRQGGRQRAGEERDMEGGGRREHL